MYLPLIISMKYIMIRENCANLIGKPQKLFFRLVLMKKIFTVINQYFVQVLGCIQTTNPSWYHQLTSHLSEVQGGLFSWSDWFFRGVDYTKYWSL